MGKKNPAIEPYDARGLPRFKEWIMERAEEDGIPVQHAYIRFYRGRYRPIKRHRVNRRVIYVEELSA